MTTEHVTLQVGGLGGPGNHKVMCTFHFQTEDTLIMDTVGEDLVEAWKNATEALFRATFSDSYAIEMYKVRKPTDPSYGEDFPQALAQGLLTGEQIPGQMSCYVNFRTGKIGRRFRGGNHLWPYSEAASLAGLFSNAYLSTVQDFCDGVLQMGDGITTRVYNLEIWSTANQAGELVTSGAPSLIPANMNRRKPGRGV